MKISEFEVELQRISPKFTIKPNPKVPGMAGVYYGSLFQFAVPSGDIFDEKRSDYNIEMPNGSRMMHRTRPEAVAMAKNYIWRLQNEPGFADAELGEESGSFV